MVTTPVPPIPATTIPHVEVSVGSNGCGTVTTGASFFEAAAGFFKLPPLTVTKLGQKPLTQEKSLLQVLWLMLRLRPNSVSCGCTATQLLCSEQSPQPSQTSSLISTRLSTSTRVPRLRSRRFLVAHIWT